MLQGGATDSSATLCLHLVEGGKADDGRVDAIDEADLVERFESCQARARCSPPLRSGGL